MREAISEDQVEAIFREVGECLDKCEDVYRLWGAAYADDAARAAPAGSVQSMKTVTSLVRAMRELKSRCEVLAKDLQPLAQALPALLGGAVRASGVTASCWTLGVVELARVYTQRLEDWERVEDLEQRARRDLFNEFSHLGGEFQRWPDFALFKANVDVEASKMRERAEAMSPEIRYRHEFMELKQQSRRLFRLLTDRKGRWVKYHEIGNLVCDDPDASEERIQKAMWRLRDALRRMGSQHVADAIESEPGRYRLRG